MCGRFTLTLGLPALQQEMGIISVPPDWNPRYNVAPSQPIAVVADADERAVEWMQWGLVPFWAKDPSIGNRMINARAETIAEKPAFRSAFMQRRCLILADGFYEWKRPESGKGPSSPYLFRRNENRPFAFAGLWETWNNPEGGELRSCTIVTTEANGVVAPIHDRMPVMLSGDNLWRWLTLDSKSELQKLLAPYPEADMFAYPVSRSVNRPEYDAPDLVRPAQEYTQGQF